MKRCYLILAVGFLFLTSCENEEVTDNKAEVISEYFNFEVDGASFSVNDPDHIAGTVYESSDTGVINFDFFGEITSESSQDDIYRGLVFKVCFYDGPGTYYTGTDQTISWAFSWFDDQLWENHYSYGNDPGIVIITKASENFVEGSFEYEGYNPNLETNVLIKGNFGLKLESNNDYIRM